MSALFTQLSGNPVTGESVYRPPEILGAARRIHSSGEEKDVVGEDGAASLLDNPYRYESDDEKSVSSRPPAWNILLDNPSGSFGSQLAYNPLGSTPSLQPVEMPHESLNLNSIGPNVNSAVSRMEHG